MEGSGVGDLLLPLAVMLVLGVAFFAAGVFRFGRRFA
jgi:hypothetical protein